MCGISGFFNRNEKSASSFVIEKMNDTLVHRGPDFGNTRLFESVALAHRRLSIIDLSARANQPMSSNDGRFTIVFNGEVYNFREIRQQLEKAGVEFSSSSDTEVVLKAYITLGVKAFCLFNGMFALAIYDEVTRKLILARDQFGVKPLYYFINRDLFVFGSEIKAILTHPDVQTSLNSQALAEYMWFGNPLGKETIYNEIKEVRAGSYLVASKDSFDEKTYFNIYETEQRKIPEPDVVNDIKVLFDEGIKRHLISDVPVGVFLSGGVDSSAITAVASTYYPGKLKTFSVSFDYDKGINELPLAREVANKFNTEHHEINISGSDITDVIENLVIAHDEPFGDAADIPLYLLTKQIKGAIKVVLQGDGGDELFGGYKRYKAISKMQKWKLFSFLAPWIAASGTQSFKLLRVQRFLNAIGEKNDAVANALLLTMESKYTQPFRVFNKDMLETLSVKDPFKKFREIYGQYPNAMDKSQKLFYTDAQVILKDTYFEKVDKATMANSIEVRVPFVDKNLAEYMLSIPSDLKIKNGIQKYLLKRAMDGIVPDKILYGKKKGFGVPYDYWLRSSLSDYFLEQVTTKKNETLLNRNEILKMFRLHQSNKGNFGFLLWKVLIFSVWNNQRLK